MSKLKYISFCLLMSYMQATVYAAEAPAAEVAEAGVIGDVESDLNDDNASISESSMAATDKTVESEGQGTVAVDDNEITNEPPVAASAEALDTEDSDSETGGISDNDSGSSAATPAEAVDTENQGAAIAPDQANMTKSQTAETLQSEADVDASPAGDDAMPVLLAISMEQAADGAGKAGEVIGDVTVTTESTAVKAGNSVNTAIQGQAESTVDEAAPAVPDGMAVENDSDGMVEQSQSEIAADKAILETMIAVKTGSGSRIPAAESGIRKGQTRPAEQFSIDLFERPLTIGGSFDALWNQESDLAFDDYDDDYSFTLYSLSLEFFYEISESVSFFADGAVFDWNDTGDSQSGAERYQTWVLFEEVFDSDFDIKLGAQYFSDERAWWWDDDLDAISIQYWGDGVQAEFAFTQSLARKSTVDDFIDPAEENLNRLLGTVSWEHSEDHWLELFYVEQNDHSATEGTGTIINSDQLDDIDADLRWIGLRSYGYLDVGNNGEVDYWLDTAYVDGNEVFISTSDVAGNPANEIVDDVTSSAVQGWAVDLGLTWYTEFPLSPGFTIGYAVGSGKLDAEGNFNTAFQQTGIQGNSYYFSDVNYVPYYGELMDPELSNLRILTLGVSIPLLENTALDLFYHQYDQYVATEFLRYAGIEMDTDGNNKDIGQEIDIILRALEFVHWEYGITAAFFKAGDAFDADSGEMASSLSFDLRYNF